MKIMQLNSYVINRYANYLIYIQKELIDMKII